MSKKKVSAAKIKLSVSSVQLNGEGMSRVSSLCVRISLPGGISSRSLSQRTQNGEAAFKPAFSETYSLDTERDLHDVIIQALKTSAEDDSDILIQVIDTSTKKSKKTIGEASYRLEQALATGQDHSGPIAIKDSHGVEIGKVVCSFDCLATLRQLDEKIRAEAAREWVEGTPEEGQIVVSVSSVRLRVTGKSRPSAIQLRTTLLGLSTAERVSEPISLTTAGDGCASTRTRREVNEWRIGCG